MEFKKAFDYIVGKVEEELVKQNYTKQKVVAENDNELVSLFTSATLAYSVVYYHPDPFPRLLLHPALKL